MVREGARGPGLGWVGRLYGAAVLGVAIVLFLASTSWAVRWRSWFPSGYTGKARKPQGKIQVGEVEIRRMDHPPELPNAFQQDAIRRLYPPHPEYARPEAVAEALAAGGASEVEGKLGRLVFFSAPLQDHLASSTVVLKLLEGTTGGLATEMGTGTVVLVGATGAELRQATPSDLPALAAGGGDYLFPRIFVFGGPPAYNILSWMQGSDRLLEAIHAVQATDLFGSIETWAGHPASLVGVSKGGLDSMTGAYRLRTHYPKAIHRVVAIDSPIAAEKGGVMDVPKISHGWIKWHENWAGRQAGWGLEVLKRKRVNQHLKNLGTTLTYLKRHILDVAVYSSIFSPDFSEIDRDVKWYEKTAQQLYQETGRHNDGSVFAPKRREPGKFVMRYLENHEKGIKSPGALDSGLRALR